MGPPWRAYGSPTGRGETTRRPLIAAAAQALSVTDDLGFRALAAGWSRQRGLPAAEWQHPCPLDRTMGVTGREHWELALLVTTLSRTATGIRPAAQIG
jgi:hypothetical protein